MLSVALRGQDVGDRPPIREAPDAPAAQLRTALSFAHDVFGQPQRQLRPGGEHHNKHHHRADKGQRAPDDVGHGTALDPTPLYTHFYHWVELADRAREPVKSPIRAAEPLYDIYAGRSEGMATAMEEVLMHAGLYDDNPRSREIVWIMLANRAARGLASLYVQSNDMSLDEAGKFHARWTPRKWSDPASDLVAFEQLLYLRQPGYGVSYVTGKLELDRLISEYAYDQEQRGAAFDLPEFFRILKEAGIVPFATINDETTQHGADARE
ncbi:MAG: hypothetical protein HXY21_10925 [Parvularculaceae bacterium]|nr:hypothetical protein [Parvularculaceae bacterium]